MNIALLGVVVLVVLDNEGSYDGYLNRNYKSPVVSATRAIKLAAALVSMPSFETAMLAQFDEESSPQGWRLMTGLTGGGVCLIVFMLAVFMIVRSEKQTKRIKNSKIGREEFG